MVNRIIASISKRRTSLRYDFYEEFLIYSIYFYISFLTIQKHLKIVSHFLTLLNII